MLSRESKRTVHKRRMYCPPRWEQTWTINARSSSRAPEPNTKSEGKNPTRGKSLRGWSPSGKTSRRPSEDYIHGTCTNPSCDSWHPPVSQNYKTESDAISVKSAFLCSEGLTVSLTKDRKSMVVKVLLLCGRILGKQIAFARTLSRRNPVRIYGRAQKSSGPMSSVQVSKGAT